MSSYTDGLRNLNINDRILNHQNIKHIDSIDQLENKENMNQSKDINTKSFKLSPTKERHLDALSPLKSPSNTSFNIHPLSESTNKINSSSSSYVTSNTSTIFSPSPNPNNSNNLFDLSCQPSALDYKRRMKEISDLTIVNKDLIKELDNLQNEINHKNQIIDIKSLKISELMHENNRLLSEIKNERKVNEKDFNSWLDLKTNLELQVCNLKNLIDKSISESNNINVNKINNDDTNDVIDSLYSKIKLYENDINKLKKKVNALQKENELEVQSKFMIIEELEMMRERYLEVDEKHELLKLDYNDLAQELLSQNISDYDDLDNKTNEDSDVITPTLESSFDMNIQNSNEIEDRILNVRKKRFNSKSTDNLIENNCRSTSRRNNSLNKAIRDVELKSQKQKYSQELVKYEFEIKSLKLQNEKLLSYIGYSLQSDITNSIDNSKNSFDSDFNVNERISSYGSTASNKTATFDNIEYSDAINIKNAKKNLKTVIKSASALPIRPDFNYLTPNTFSSVPITIKKKHKHKLKNSKSIEFINDDNINTFNDNDSMIDINNNSMDYSTDYNQGEIECIDIGGSDLSFEEYGDDELEEEEDNILNQNEQNLINDESNFNANRLYSKKNMFSSSSSLDVSFKMNLTPQLNLKRSKLFKRAPETQFKKLTGFPSTLDLKNKKRDDKIKNDIFFDNENLCKSESFNIINDGFTNDSNNNVIDENIEIFNDEIYPPNDFDIKLDSEFKNVPIDDSNEHNSNDNIRRNNLNYFSMYQISEEDESEYDDNYGMEFSSSEDDDDDGDEDETFNISNQEINMFKIDFLRRLYCPKHSMFQCFCRSMDLVSPTQFRIFSSPIYSLRRKMRKSNDRKGTSLDSLKLRSKLISTSTKWSHPMRYHEHEKEILQIQETGLNLNEDTTLSNGENNNNKNTDFNTGTKKGISGISAGTDDYSESNDILVID